MRYFIFILSLLCLACEPIDLINKANQLPTRCTSLTDLIFSIQIDSIHYNSLELQFNGAQNTSYALFYRAEGSRFYYKSNQSEVMNNQHAIKLNFLRPNTNYEYLLKDETNDCICNEKQLFTTEKMLHIPSGGKITRDNLQADMNSFILTHERNAQQKEFFLIDEQGYKVWSYQIASERSPKVFSITSDNTILTMLSDSASLLWPSDELLEIDYSGNIINQLTFGEGGFDKYIHHDVQKYNNLYHAITYDTAFFDLSAIGGTTNDRIIGDGMIVLDAGGNKVWEWSVFDVRSPIDDPAILKRKNDWLHLNTFAIDADGNYWMSFRNTDEIWKVNANTGQLMWSYSDETLSGQHSLNLIESSYMSVFNNSLATNQSSVAIYNTSLGNINGLLKEVLLPQEFFSYVMGSAVVRDENILVCSTTSGALLISDFGGNVLWQYQDLFFPFRAYFVKPPNQNFTKYYE